MFGTLVLDLSLWKRFGDNIILEALVTPENKYN